MTVRNVQLPVVEAELEKTSKDFTQARVFTVENKHNVYISMYLKSMISLNPED